MSSTPFLKLNNGLNIPAIGIGTWRAPDDEVSSALKEAIAAGYRHIDCAPVYENEKTIGKVIKQLIDSKQITREELFITTKLPISGNRASSVEKYLRNSLADLQLDYIDLYLIHTPFAVPDDPRGVMRDANGDVLLETTDHDATWKQMEEMVKKNLTKSIGISNFNKEQIEAMFSKCTIKPAILQIELHLYMQQHELVDYCKSKDIIVTAYSPLGSKGIAGFLRSCGVERQIPDLLENPILTNIAKRLNKTPAQVALKWILQRGATAIPKSVNSTRLRQNLDLFNFELSEQDMVEIRSLDKGIRVCDFSFFKGMNKHPQFPW